MYVILNFQNQNVDIFVGNYKLICIPKAIF